MVLAEVQEGTPVPPVLQATRAVGSEDSPKIENNSGCTTILAVNEVWRGGLDGGSVSALDVRLLGSGDGTQEGVVGEQGG